MTFKRVISSVLAASALTLGAVGTMSVVSTAAQAQSTNAKQIVDQAKNSGLIGETVAGYLAVVDNTADASVIDAMNEINIRRKSLYTRLAREQNVQIEVVAKLTGEKVLRNAKPGQKILGEDGRWKTAG